MIKSSLDLPSRPLSSCSFAESSSAYALSVPIWSCLSAHESFAQTVRLHLVRPRMQSHSLHADSPLLSSSFPPPPSPRLPLFAVSTVSFKHKADSWRNTFYHTLSLRPPAQTVWLVFKEVEFSQDAECPARCICLQVCVGQVFPRLARRLPGSLAHVLVSGKDGR